MTLTGKRALITGGGTGVGAALARTFAEAGAEVVVAGRRLEPLETVAASLPGTRAVRADVTDEASVRAMFAEAGPCDIVIANAGAADSAPFGRTGLDQWNAMLAVNLTGTFLTFREGLAQLPGWGRLIAVASIAGLKGAAYIAPYAAAKHGVVGMVRSLALEVARKPVTVNALCPGYLDTEMTDRTVANIVAKTGKTRDEAIAVLAATNPQRRLIHPDEVAAAALWLCAPGSESINGQAIAITGGRMSDPLSKRRLKMWIRLLGVTRLAEGQLREFLRVNHGTTLPRFDVMAALYRRREGVTMTELSRMLLVSNGNATVVVDRLEQDGLARRTASETDRRTTYVSLTPEGLATFERLASDHEAEVSRIFADLSESDIEQLTDILKRTGGRK